MRRRRVATGLRHASALAAAFAVASPLASQAETPGPFALTDISDALMRAYNDEDAEALHGLLAPPATRRRLSERRWSCAAC